ncbi:nitrate- and nitrite sensing domain-containing protein [Streptosporangium soli]|nr:nitrate- and nitrite sensing domain-containing protein [Streptosporangium sp. KLBMP 9127]
MRSAPPIRSKILRILLVPLISLIVLWAFMAYTTVGEIVGLSQAANRWQAIGEPSRAVVLEIQRERQLSAQFAGRTNANGPLQAQRRLTDGKVATLREVANSLDLQGASQTDRDNLRSLLSALDGLAALRANADAGRSSPLEVTEAFNAFVVVANRQYGGSNTITSASSYRVLRGLSAYSTMTEHLARAHAVLTPALTRGAMTRAEHAAFITAMANRRTFLASAEQDMGPELKVFHKPVAASPGFQRIPAAENKIFAWDLVGKPPVDAAVWKQDAETAVKNLEANSQQELARASAKGERLKIAALVQIGLVVGLGLLAVILSILASYRFGRALIDELKQLQASAVELAEERLPRLVQRLRKGDDVDPVAEAPDLKPANTAEADRVVQAFSAVWSTAVEAAVGQAKLRKGVSQVFLNLARRNQALLHRQLTLLDTMERKVEEPDTLEDLFKLDHLTTRMRRHAENLIILSDAAPGRRWRDPVPVFDVLRSSVLEVEDYTRVTVLPVAQAPLLVGSAVTDVIHLVAELVENATVFSPPNTVVHVRGLAAANGFGVEIEDRGLGLNQARIDEINARLASPPEFDLAGSDRMGLFVVARLAARHGIKVMLRPSPYDGTTAIVMLPPHLLAGPDTPYTGTPAVDSGLPYSGVPRTDNPLRGLSASPLRPSAMPMGAPTAQLVADSSDSGADWFAAPLAPVTEPNDDFDDDLDDDLDGLPRRVRQANLAPQLRGPQPRERPEVSTRSPEELFDLMSSMQLGWQQGRSEADKHRDVWNGKEGHADGRP